MSFVCVFLNDTLRATKLASFVSFISNSEDHRLDSEASAAVCGASHTILNGAIDNGSRVSSSAS